MHAPTALRSFTLTLIVTAIVTLIVIQPSAPTAAAPKGRAAARPPDKEALVKREKILRRVDTSSAASAELRAVRGWFVLASWLGKEGEEERSRRVLQLAELELNLAERLVKLAQLKAEVKRLERALVRTKGSIVKTNEKIKQRGAYLKILRRSR